MYYLGIDVGSLSCNAVVVDQSGCICARTVVPTGAKNIEAIENVIQQVKKLAKISEGDIGAIVATGYGRNRVKKRDCAITEITCHAYGIMFLLKETRLLLDSLGNVANFVMNDKYAAGTGRFIETMARALQVDIEEIGEMDIGFENNLTLSSMCIVFAESEIVSMIANGGKSMQNCCKHE